MSKKNKRAQRKKEFAHLKQLLTEVNKPGYYSDLLSAAIAYAEAAHKGDRFKFVPGRYFEHSKAVASRMPDLETKVAALLHDVVEHRVEKILGKRPDHSEEKALKEYARREEEIVQIALAEIVAYFVKCGHVVLQVISAVDKLTRRATMTSDEHLQQIIGFARQELSEGKTASGGIIALKVKIADLEHNKRRDRFPNNLSQKDQQQMDSAERRYGMVEKAFPQNIFPHLWPAAARKTHVKLGKRPRDRRAGKAVRKGWVYTDGPGG